MVEKAEKIGYLKEVVVERIGRIRPLDEVEGRGHKAEAEVGEGG